MRRTVAALAAAAVLVSSCQAAGTGDTPATSAAGSPSTTAPVETSAPPSSAPPEVTTTASPSSTTPTTVAVEANPTSLDYVYDDELAASASIGPDGGQLTATGGDGTTFELSVPPDALLSELTITMTPVAAASGAVLDEAGAQAAAVRLEPSGLVFFAPATLRITNPAFATDAEPFATSQGDELHLVPSTAEGGGTTIPVFHFSEFGVAYASENFTNVVSQYVTTAQDTRAQNELVILARTARTGRDLDEGRSDIFARWGQVLLNRMSAAGRSDEALIQATGEFVWWVNQVRAYGMSLDESTLDVMGRLSRSWLEAVDVAIRRAHQHCVRDAEPEAAFNVVRWYAVAAMMLFSGIVTLDDDTRKLYAEWRELIPQCFSFDIVYHTTVATPTRGGAVTVDTTARIPISVGSVAVENDRFTSPNVSGDIVVDSVESTPQPICPITTGPGTATVVLDLDLNLVERDLSQTTVESVTLWLTVDPQIRMACTSPVNTDIADAFWFFPLTQANRELARVTYWAIAVPIVSQGSLYAKWTDHAEVVETSVDQTIQIVHTPGG